MKQCGAILAPALFAFFLLAATYKVASMPNYTFDSYMYSYVASVDEQTFRMLPGVPDKYIAMSSDAYHFQAPYYQVKILYVALVRTAAALVGTLRAPPMVSASAYFLLGLVIWCWLSALAIDGPWRAVTAALIMSSSVLTDTARLGTPDLLCSVLLVAGAWLVTATRQSAIGAVVLILAVYARTDCSVLAGLLLLLACRQGKMSPQLTAIALAAMLGSYLVIATIGNSYGQLLAFMLELTRQPSYVSALLNHAAKTEIATYSPFALLALVALKQRYQVDLIAVCAVSLVARYLLLPHFEIRYLIPQAVIVAVVGAASVLHEKLVGAAASTLPATDSRARE